MFQRAGTCKNKKSYRKFPPANILAWKSETLKNHLLSEMANFGYDF